MAANIKTVGVIGTGVIGASWVGLFLANGLRVLVSDPAPDAEQKLSAHLQDMWPLLERRGISPGASLSNYTFVGASLAGHYQSVDFVQEVGFLQIPVWDSNL
jgi:3-hydroxyacyl-CoA dehydrogenase